MSEVILVLNKKTEEVLVAFSSLSALNTAKFAGLLKTLPEYRIRKYEVFSEEDVWNKIPKP